MVVAGGFVVAGLVVVGAIVVGTVARGAVVEVVKDDVDDVLVVTRFARVARDDPELHALTTAAAAISSAIPW